MEGISKSIKIGVSPEVAFQKFVKELKEWWPKEYTWSQEKLEKIQIEAKKGGLCTEIGPHGFRCDWGRVTEWTENTQIGLKWQISPKREPIPNPEKASDIKVDFVEKDHLTILDFQHFNFENHGENSDDYRKMMDSEQGWDYILNNFKTYCEKH
ncbi:MAG: SRPBCC domain-containing protein [Marinoscillum sp.]